MGHYDYCENSSCENPDAEAAQGLLGMLDQKRKRFQETENPVDAWEAWRFCRESHLPIPDWVVSYLDRCAAFVGDLATDPYREWSRIPVFVSLFSTFRFRVESGGMRDDPMHACLAVSKAILFGSLFCPIAAEAQTVVP